MTAPCRIEFGVGLDAFGRQTKLVGALTASRTYLWSIVSAPANQRDDGEAIHSLTSAQLQELGRIATNFVKAGE